MNITVIGLGYIGVVTSACLSKVGHHIIGVDIIKNKVDLINEGRSPIIEPQVDELINEAYNTGKLKALLDEDYNLVDTDVVIICVGTPSNSAGEVDLGFLIKVTNSLIDRFKDIEVKPAVIYRSTVPPETMENIILPLYKNNFTSIDFPIIYHPEFLREGSAVKDFFANPQIVVASVIGINQIETESLFRKIYKDIQYRFYYVDVKTSEMTKYLNNTYHALKVAFVNEFSKICSVKGINTHELFRIFLEDEKLNISKAYLKPGFAYGGSCLPKDIRGITTLARHSNINMPIAMHIENSNELHIDFAFKKIMDTGLDKIGFYGLSFKPDTDDTRESPYVKLIEKLIGKGKEVKIFDESINLNTIMGKNLKYLSKHIPHISSRLVRDIEDLINFCDMIIMSHYEPKLVEVCQTDNSKMLIDISGKLMKDDLSNNIKSLII